MATATFTIKQGDTGPALQATLLGANGAAQDLTGAAVKFNLRNAGAPRAIKIDHGACTVVSAPAGTVSYAWQSADTDTPGTYLGEFEATLSGGMIVTFPNDSHIIVEIIAQDA